MAAPAPVVCPFCHHSNPAGTVICPVCHSHFPVAGDQSTQCLPPALSGEILVGSIHKVEAGTLIGDRYEILSLLGTGGMGAVYKAHDRELDRTIALKVIRPELAANPQVLQRFKQEIILARQISHKNVIRIFDFGTADGLVYITMEYIEGDDLGSFAEKQKPSFADSARLVRRILQALEAAHAEGVVHRDLKPQNIMISTDGRVAVMDFGLARSIEQPGVTQAGALLGTPHYMSPEQAEGKPLDTRSDLFAVGIIFYQLLTGTIPFQADTVLASLLKRTRETPPPPSQLNSDIPQTLSDIVAKCLVVDPAQRYQTASEVLADIDAALAGSPVSIAGASSIALPRPAGRNRTIWAYAIAAVVLVAVASIAIWRWQNPRIPTPQKPVTLLVADFNNGTGDPLFDGAVEPMFNFAVEGAGFITTYNRGQARKLAKQLDYAPDKLDEASARLIAVREGLNVVVSGSVTREGSGYAVSAKATDAVTGKTIATAKASASSKEDVVSVMPKLVLPIRRALGDSTPRSAQLAAVETFTAGSLEAVQYYAQGQDLMFSGKFDEARSTFLKVTNLDPNFGRAYAALAVASLNLGRREEGEKYFKLALSHLDRMTERERYRTRGAYYIMMGDSQKCVDEFTALVAEYPSDTAGHNNLALCYTHLRMMAKAVEKSRHAVEISPKHAMLRNNLALFSSYSGDFTSAEEQARAAQKLNPTYAKGYIALAFAQLGQGQVSNAAETYRKLEALGGRNASQAAAGLADLALYEGRLAEAAGILEKAAAADVTRGDTELAAAKFASLAYIELLRHHPNNAVSAAERALANSKEAKIALLAGRALLDAGEGAKVRGLIGRLEAERNTEPHVYGRLLEGGLALKEGNARRATAIFTEANNQLDTWMGRFDLGRSYLEVGAYIEADSEFDRCIRRRGEALSLFLDENPTYGYFPPIYYFAGRVRESLKSSGFADSYRTYLSIRGKAGEDPLLAEVRRRSGQ